MTRYPPQIHTIDVIFRIKEIHFIQKTPFYIDTRRLIDPSDLVETT